MHHHSPNQILAQDYQQNFNNGGNQTNNQPKLTPGYDVQDQPGNINDSEICIEQQFGRQLQINNQLSKGNSENVNVQQNSQQQDFDDEANMAAKGIKKFSTPTKDAVKQQVSIFANQHAYQNDHQNFETAFQNQKIPQTVKILPQSRKMSGPSENRSQQVIFDDGLNFMSDIQEPSDDHPSELLPRDLLYEDEGHDSQEVRQDDHQSNINSIDDQKYFEENNHIEIKNPVQPKRQRSQHVQKSGDFTNDIQNYGHIIDQFHEQKNIQNQNLNINTPQINNNIRSQQYNQGNNVGYHPNKQYQNKQGYVGQIYQGQQHQMYPPPAVRQQYFLQYPPQTQNNHQQQQQQIQQQMALNQQQQHIAKQNQMVQQPPQDINNININLPVYQEQQQQMPMGHQGYVHQRGPFYSGQHNLTPQDYINPQMENQIYNQNNQRHFQQYKPGAAIKAYQYHGYENQIIQNQSNQIQPGPQNQEHLSESIHVLNQQNDRQSVNSAMNPIMRKNKKSKKAFNSEKMQINPSQELQNNQNEFMDDQKRKQKSNTMDDTSGTKPNSGSRGWGGSHKAPHQQHSMNDHYSQDQNYQGRNYKKNNSAGSNYNNYGSMQERRSGGHHGTNSHNSGQSFEQKLQMIQSNINKCNDDPVKEWEVLDGHIMELATKKVGSKFLQDHLQKHPKGSSQLIKNIIEQIDDQLAELMTDNYGNYFCKKLIQYLMTDQRIHLLKKIKGQHFVDISSNKKGTWVIQEFIAAVTQEEEFELIKQNLLENDNICRLSKNDEGEHMIEKIITTFSEDKRQYIFDVICENFNQLATHKQGLCVMKKLIEYTRNKNSQKIIVGKILEDPLAYVQNEFGNFVVSEVLQRFDYQINKQIFDKMKGNFVKLSQNKYSSKFIEICIEKAPVYVQHEIFDELCTSNQLPKVIQSQYGNYVLQKSLKEFCKTNDQKIKLLKAIIRSLSEVNEYKVQQKWGNELLKGHIEDLRNDQDQKLELENLLYEQMDKINVKNKQFKHNQMHHISHGSSGNYSQGSGGNGSGGGFSGYGKQPQKGFGAYEDQYNDHHKKKKNNLKQNQNQIQNKQKPMILKKDHIQYADKDQ